MYEILTGIVQNYSSFFSINNVISTLSDPVNWGVIFSLIILEGLLSSDNALVLAILVRHLPPQQRSKALFYGIAGAYFFRFLAIGLGTYLIKIWWIKAAGGLYLLYLVYKYWIEKNNKKQCNNNRDDNKAHKNQVSDVGIAKGLLGTIVTVELMDITFSVDSITAAFGISEKIWVLFLGGCLGIAMMRGIAKTFITLINKIPELEDTAYILITIVGLKMIAGTAGYILPDIFFFGLLISVFLGTIIYHYKLTIKEVLRI